MELIRGGLWGYAIALAGSALGVPLFLRLPPWPDVTLYQVAVESWLRGEPPYAGVFDTNLPGFPFLLLPVQAVAGPSNLAVRVMDLCVMGAVTALLFRLARRCGATPPALGWLVAGCVWFYLFTAEFSHAQRDPWLLLPSLAAVALRLGRLGRVRAGLGGAFAEGLLWGVAVWVKPHVVVPMAVAATVGVRLARRSLSARGVAAEVAATFLGGLTAGGVGVGLLVVSGGWGPFWEVMTAWNPGYTQATLARLPGRLVYLFDYFAPWTYLVVPAGVVAARQALFPAPGLPRDRADARALLAALAAGWFAQATVLQNDFDYVHVPEVLLALAILAGAGWCPARYVVAWLALSGAAFALSDVYLPDGGLAGRLPRVRNLPRGRPAAFDPRAITRWGDCFAGDTPELRDALARQRLVTSSATWADLELVARFLETREPRLTDGELLCYHNSPHPLYLRLGVRPAARFMHWGTVERIPGAGGRVAAELESSAPRFAVSDLACETKWLARTTEVGPGGDPLALPGWLPESRRRVFPFDRPIVFRAGRYAVHEVGPKPVRAGRIPTWEELTQ